MSDYDTNGYELDSEFDQLDNYLDDLAWGGRTALNNFDNSGSLTTSSLTYVDQAMIDHLDDEFYDRDIRIMQMRRDRS